MKSLRTTALLLTLCALIATACNRDASQPVTRTESTTAQIQPASLVTNTSANSGDAATSEAPAEPTMLAGPNAVPKDTRIVVNIPAFRMDVFKNGTLLKSFKIGIGYVEYPLPRGLRKAEMIIFNPTWTQPNEPWASNPGQVVPAGAAGNPLGPIKVPIGGANLIHGGKPLAKIGTFASHGCVGLTNEQVKDFAKVLAEATDIQLSADTMASYLKRRTRTQVVKLPQIVPVELRYETIVVEDGRVRIYRDVYGQKTNTEENLRATLEKNGISFDALSEQEKSQMLEILNIVSRNPKKQPTPPPTATASLTKEEKLAAAAARRAEAERVRKLRSQRQFEVTVAALIGKGYPAPVSLNDGKPVAVSKETQPRQPAASSTR